LDYGDSGSCLKGFLNNMETTLLHISGTDMNWTVDKMREFIIKDTINLDVRKKAQEITWSIPGRDVDLIATEIYDWIKKHIKYQYDPVSEEWVQDSLTTLKLESGDCDDFTVLGASLIRSLGIPARICFVKTNNEKSFSHVYFEYHSDAKDKWIPFDAIVNRYPGWESPTISEKVVVEIETGKSVKTIGSGSIGNLGSDSDKVLGAAAAAGALLAATSPLGIAAGAAALADQLVGLFKGLVSGPSYAPIIGVDGVKSVNNTSNSETKDFMGNWTPKTLTEIETAIQNRDLNALEFLYFSLSEFRVYQNGRQLMVTNSRSGKREAWNFQNGSELIFLYNHTVLPLIQMTEKAMRTMGSTYRYNGDNSLPPSGTSYAIKENLNAPVQTVSFAAVPEMPPQPVINEYFSNGIPNIQKFSATFTEIANVRLRLEAFSKSSGKNLPAPSISVSDGTTFDKLNELWIRTNNYRNALIGISDSTGTSYAGNDTPWGTLLLIGAGASKILGWW